MYLISFTVVCLCDLPCQVQKVTYVFNTLAIIPMYKGKHRLETEDCQQIQPNRIIFCLTANLSYSYDSLEQEWSVCLLVVRKKLRDMWVILLIK